MIIDKINNLNNIILISDQLEIKSGFEGNLQAFIKDTIIIEEKVILNYPSAIVVNNTSDRGYIEIKNKSIINGVIYQFGKTENKSSDINVLISEGAKIEGELFAEGNVEFRGVLAGSATVGQFFYRTSSGKYRNYLVDAEINISKRNPYYLTPIKTGLDEIEILEWLD